MAVTEALNISENTMMLKIRSRPRNFFLASGNAAIEAKMMCPAVPTAVMNTELKA